MRTLVRIVAKTAVSVREQFTRGMGVSVLALGLMLGVAAPAAAALVEYNWVPSHGTGGSGSMIFDLGAGTDGANFSLAPSALTAFSFEFNFESTVTPVALADLTVQASGWSAANGFLTSVALLSKSTLPQFTFQYQPYAGLSTAVIQTATGAQQNFGVWQQNPVAPSAVPVPAALPLLLAGLGGFAMFRRRTPR